MAKTVNLNVKATGASKASKDLKKVDKGLGGIAKSAAKVAAGFFTAQGLIVGLQKVIDATRTQVLAEAQLNAVLKSTAGAAGLTSKQLTGMAAALQKQTRFGDEAIIKAQSLLLTFTKVGKEVFPDAIETVLNMSEAMGQDLQQGVIQVGKALNDPILGVTALRRVGVQLSAQQEQQVKDFVAVNDIASAQKIILSELETQFGGVAKAAGETMAGSIDKMNNAIGDTQEAIGEVLSPIIIAITEDMKEFAIAVDESAPKFQGVANVVGVLIDKFGLFGMTTIGMKNAMAAANAEFKAMEESDLPRMIAPTEDEPMFGALDEGLTFGDEDDLTAFQDQINQHIEMFGATEDIKTQILKEAAAKRQEILREEQLGEIPMEIYEASVNAMKISEDAKTKLIQDHQKKRRQFEAKAHKERIQENLQSAILSGQSAKDAALSVIKAEIAEAQAGLISSIMKSLPFPVNLAVAAGAGALIGKVTDKLFSFQTGGSFVTKGRTTLPIGNGVVVGDNASGMERIDVTPLPAPPSGSDRNVNIYISAPLVDETVVDHIIPAIRRAEQLNL